MRISDWSSDVCSSDLDQHDIGGNPLRRDRSRRRRERQPRQQEAPRGNRPQRISQAGSEGAREGLADPPDRGDEQAGGQQGLPPCLPLPPGATALTVSHTSPLSPLSAPLSPPTTARR